MWYPFWHIETSEPDLSRSIQALMLFVTLFLKETPLLLVQFSLGLSSSKMNMSVIDCTRNILLLSILINRVNYFLYPKLLLIYMFFL
jgi:hypothetical protein